MSTVIPRLSLHEPGELVAIVMSFTKMTSVLDTSAMSFDWIENSVKVSVNQVCEEGLVEPIAQSVVHESAWMFGLLMTRAESPMV